MEKKIKNELLDILNNKRGNMYDFIANNYWILDKDELKDIALECVALMYQYAEALEMERKGNIDNATKQAHNDLLENIKEYRETLLED